MESENLKISDFPSYVNSTNRRGRKKARLATATNEIAAGMWRGSGELVDTLQTVGAAVVVYSCMGWCVGVTSLFI